MLFVVFFSWQKTEKTLSIHSIDTPRREAFYWASVVATFALGTAVGDLTATTFHLGYFSSGLLFAGLICIPAIGFRWFGWNPIFSFWFAYVATSNRSGLPSRTGWGSPGLWVVSDGATGTWRSC